MRNHTNGMALIQKVANGYIVTLPVEEVNHTLQAYRAIPRIAREMRDEGDPLLDKLQGKESKEEPEEIGFKLDITDNVFVFVEWDEALSFLDEKLGPELPE